MAEGRREGGREGAVCLSVWSLKYGLMRLGKEGGRWGANASEARESWSWRRSMGCQGRRRLVEGGVWVFFLGTGVGMDGWMEGRMEDLGRV